MNNRYPARFEHDPGGGVVVSFRDIPEALTQGDNLEEAREMARDALITAMDFYFEDGRSVPEPSARQEGEELVDLPASVATKVLLLNAMAEDKVRPTDLACAMGVPKQEVSRILDLHHTTKIDTVAAALRAIGRNLTFSAARA